MSATHFNIESVFRCAKGIVIIGWATDHRNKVQTITINENHTFDLSTDGIFLRTERPDVNSAFNIPSTEVEKLGFVLWIPFDSESEITIHFENAVESAQTKKIVSIQRENKFLADCFPHSGDAVREIAMKKNDANLLFALQRTSLKIHPDVKTNRVNDARFGAFAIDHSFSLDNSGIVIIGWDHLTTTDPISIEVHSTSGDIFPIEKIFSNFRPDVVQNVQNTYPDISNNCGFIFFVTAEIKNTEEYGLRFKFEQCDIWIHLQLETQVSGRKLIKKVLESIPSPHHLMHSIYDIYNSGLGRVFEKIIAKYKLEPPAYSERQFGIATAQPKVSVIVPLYGRYDFMRHQLAHFVSDKDFDDADLIYVVDDPSIHESVLITAISYHALFQKPFRVIWYDCNLGFGGANNVGVRAAKAEHLMLMNSDVIPQNPGWLSTLLNAYKTLPNAGILGPLLQFADNSVQHAGMKATRDPYLPGFLLNTHPGKGWQYNLSEEPSEQQLLTAACILLSKEDFLAVGGFDEGYVIGDFEDSDLCMAIKKRGKKLWLVPEVKLWHLERQSQNIGTISGYRQLVTLYNGWRYHEKIIRGEIANPETEE